MRTAAMLLVALCLAAMTAACAGTITPNGDASAPLDRASVDGGLYFDSASEPFEVPDGFVIPDRLPVAPNNGRACTLNRIDECGPGAACAAARIRTATDPRGRYASPGRCVDSLGAPFLTPCDLTGEVRYQLPGMACLGFPGDPFNSTITTLLTIRDCLRLREEALLQARPGEEVTQCWFSDQTVATTPAFPVAGCRGLDRDKLMGCGLTCEGCDAATNEICMFVSATFRNGVCLPRTNRLTQTSMVCKAQNPRIACPRGQGCIFPLRGDRDGIPDRERRGICAPLAECTRIVGWLPRGYICDQTLVQ